MLAPHPHDDSARLLGRPQFSLRTLFLALTAACGLFAGMASVGALVWSMIVMFVLLVAAHVAGNAIGTRLRDGADSRRKSETYDFDPFDPDRLAARSRPKWQPPPITRMQQFSPLGWKVFVTSASFSIVGGAIGGMWLTVHYWHRISAPGIVLGTLASAVIGALAGFLLASFLAIVAESLKTASREQ